MEQEANQREKEKNAQIMENGYFLQLIFTLALKTLILALFFFTVGIQTLDTVQALCLPLGASVSLLIMFFFFDSMQLLFAVCTAGK